MTGNGSVGSGSESDWVQSWCSVTGFSLRGSSFGLVMSTDILYNSTDTTGISTPQKILKHISFPDSQGFVPALYTHFPA